MEEFCLFIFIAGKHSALKICFMHVCRPDGSEDAATGSAAPGFVGVVQHFDCLLDGHKQIWLEQGLEIGRPSRIHLVWHVEKGEIGCRA